MSAYDRDERRIKQEDLDLLSRNEFQTDHLYLGKAGERKS
jgi:hypothetical protein